ncbi:hypothetical protein MKX01_030098 [Papaver californicum]|nr:hypothetical protein MKX01_030098 [Papaver californicum]
MPTAAATPKTPTEASPTSPSPASWSEHREFLNFGTYYENEESDDEYDSIKRPAFYVEGDPDFDSGPPEDGLEYLRRVRFEAAQIPNVKVAKLDKSKLDKEQTAYMPEIPDIAKCPLIYNHPKSGKMDFLLTFLSSDRSSEDRVGNHDNNMSGDAKPDGQVLRHFFDDWPRSNQKSNGGVGNNSSPATSTTCLSISTPGNNNMSSDFSLKLSTGNVDEREGRVMNGGGERRQMNWGGGWGTHQVSSMGGPLAEALRSSITTNSSSPTSVFHEL